MAKYLSGRKKVRPFSGLSTNRHKYVSLEETEPNLGYPGEKLVSIASTYYKLVTIDNGTVYDRYWLTDTPAAVVSGITIFDEGVVALPAGNAGINTINKLNFVGAAITATAEVTGISTITVFAPGADGNVLYNNNGDIGGSSLVIIDDFNNRVGVGTSFPTETLDVNGNIRLRNALLDVHNQTGIAGSILISTGAGVSWASPTFGGAGTQGIQGTSGAPNWILKTSNYTANAGEQIIADTSGGSWTLTLPPTPSAGDAVKIADGEDWIANNLIVARNGSTIEDGTNDFILDIRGITVEFIYDGSTWEVYANVGPKGLQGTQGIQGVQGRQGTQGRQGIQGPQGTQGIQGLQGTFGNQGIQGSNANVQGIQGTQGLQGNQGIQGTQGTQGIQGITGSQGTQGLQGSQGIQGSTGIQGIQGNQGIQGIQGSNANVQGIQGSQGTQGITGSQGTQGIQGFEGIQGIQGSQGTQGIQGSNANVQGIQGTDGTQGIQGTFGDVGIQGIQGTQGTQGSEGTQGIFGVQGIVGGEGVQGISGSQGISGVQGPQGPEGPQGTQGTQGISGTGGIQGTQGIQGIQGRQGTQGLQGIQGPQGIQGTQGTQGIRGQQGTQGIAGPGNSITSTENTGTTALYSVLTGGSGAQTPFVEGTGGGNAVAYRPQFSVSTTSEGTFTKTDGTFTVGSLVTNNATSVLNTTNCALITNIGQYHSYFTSTAASRFQGVFVSGSIVLNAYSDANNIVFDITNRDLWFAATSAARDVYVTHRGGTRGKVWTDQYFPGISGVGQVGDIVFAYTSSTTAVSYGAVAAASSLFVTNAAGTTNAIVALSGSWRCIGYSAGGLSSVSRATAWIRWA